MLTRTWKPIAFACAVLIGCSEPTAQQTTAQQPTATAAIAVDHNSHGFNPNNGLVAATDTPFTYRALVKPLTVKESPNFDLKLRSTAEMTIQKVIFPPGPTIWHTHPATSFVLVASGTVKLERYVPEKAGGFCVSTPVFAPGETFVEAPNRVHRAVVTSTTPAELYVVRFNVPVGAPLTVAAADPGC